MYTAQVKPTTAAQALMQATAAQALMQAGATKPTKPNNKTTISLFDSSNDTAVFSGEAIFQLVHGTITKANGTTYTGGFSNNVPDGFGETLSMNGTAYKGFWQKGNQHGQGETTWGGGRWKHKGSYENSKYTGKGMLTHVVGSTKRTLSGVFKDGKIVDTNSYLYSRFEKDMPILKYHGGMVKLDKKGFPFAPEGDGVLTIYGPNGNSTTVDAVFKEGAVCKGEGRIKTQRIMAFGNIDHGKPDGHCLILIRGKMELNCVILGGKIENVYNIHFKDGTFLRDHTLDFKPRTTIITTGDILIEDPIIYNDKETKWLVTFKQGTSARAFGKSDNRDDYFITKILIA